MLVSRVINSVALLLDEILVAALLIFVLPKAGVNVPYWATIGIVGLLLTKDIRPLFFVMKGGMEKPPATGPEALIGEKAQVVEELRPEGVVKVKGELWTAECRNGYAEEGMEVIIMGVQGAKLLVELPKT